MSKQNSIPNDDYVILEGTVVAMTRMEHNFSVLVKRSDLTALGKDGYAEWCDQVYDETDGDHFHQDHEYWEKGQHQISFSDNKIRDQEDLNVAQRICTHSYSNGKLSLKSQQ